MAGVVYRLLLFTTDADRKYEPPDEVRTIAETLAPVGSPVNRALTAWPSLIVVRALRPAKETDLAVDPLTLLKTVDALG